MPTPFGPNYPSASGVEEAAWGVPNAAWSSVANGYANDGTPASVTLGSGGSYNPGSEYAKYTGFGFSMPGTATVTAIKAAWKAKGSSGNLLTPYLFIIQDGVVQLELSGYDVDDVFAQTSYKTVEFDGGLWGLAWTPAQINASNFGIAVAVDNQSDGLGGTVDLDYVALTVYATTTLDDATTQGVPCHFDAESTRIIHNKRPILIPC